MDTLTDLTLAHNRWLAEVDPLAGPAADLSAEQVRTTTVDGIVAGWQTTRTDPDETYSMWVPDVVETLVLRSPTPPTAHAFGRLLDAWLTERDPVAASLTVTVPALLVQAIPALLEHGFVPRTAAAARLVGEAPAPTERPGLEIRQARPDDRDAVLELLWELHVDELPYGATIDRPQARDHLGAYTDQALGWPDWAWVAVRDGEPVGVVTLNPPDDSQWVAPLVSVGPVSYLGFAAVTRRVRAGGVGGALVQRAMHRAHRAGCQVVLLDHAALSPLSSTFWHRRGFRPVWQRWARPVG